MSTKNTIIQNLITHLRLINATTHEVPGCPFSPYTYKTNLFGNVTDQLKFLDNINDFPTVTFFQTSSERRIERGGGEVYAAVNYIIRCYFLADDNADQADDFIEDIQFALNSFRYTQSNSDLVDLKILAVSSDERLLTPYGVSELSFGLIYRLTI